MKKSTKPTLADVAAAAGVSKMTASRALRGAKDVSERSAAIVRKTARDIGYIGNQSATSLSSKRSDLLAVVVPSLSNIVFAEVMSGIVEAIADSKLQPVFGVTNYDPVAENDLLRKMLSWQPAGLIVTGLDQDKASSDLLKRADLPVVQIMDTDGDPVGACIGFSQEQAGANMAQLLVSKGKNRIGYIGCALQKDTRAAKRMQGFEAELGRHGFAIADRVLSPDTSSVPTGRALTATLLAQTPDLDAIYFSNDDVAVGGVFHCLSAGIDVPGQLLLAGFNGLDIVRGLPVPLATTIAPRRDIGRAAGQLIRNWQESRDSGFIQKFDPEISADPRMDQA